MFAQFCVPYLSVPLRQLRCHRIFSLLTTLIYSVAVNHNYDPTYIGPHKVLCVSAVLAAVVLFFTQIYSGRMRGKAKTKLSRANLATACRKPIGLLEAERVEL